MFLLANIIVTFNILIFPNTDCFITYEANIITIYLLDKLLEVPSILEHTILFLNSAYFRIRDGYLKNHNI
jgi:hypothetical protein